MESLEPTAYLSNDPMRGEVFFSISGLWEADRMDAFLTSLTQTALPIIEQKRRVRLLGDFRGFVAQKRETGEAMRKQLVRARKYGLERVAIFGASMLVKLQYKRLSSGIEVEFFDTKTEALDWLRRPRNLAA